MCEFRGIKLKAGFSRKEFETIIIDGYYLTCVSVTQIESLLLNILDGSGGVNEKTIIQLSPISVYAQCNRPSLPIFRDLLGDIKATYQMIQGNHISWRSSGGLKATPMTLVLADPMVHFDGILIRDGVLDGSTDGAIYRRWQTESSAFDPDTFSSITHIRLLQLKRTLKLNDNKTVKKKGEEGYEPAYQYDFIFDVVCHNVRVITETASLDLCGNELSRAHQGWGEPGAGIIARILNKPCIAKGGQTVYLVDAYHCRPYSYLHRHKLHRKINDWNAAGLKEVRLILEKIPPFIAGGGSERVLWKSKPHGTWDNHFSGCQILNWLGEEGYAATMTCRRNRLPKNVPAKYFHTEKTANGDNVARVARFQNPISAVKIQKNPL